MTYGACSGPFSGVNIHVSHQISCDWSTTVIKGWIPAELDVLGTHFVRVQIARLEWHIEDVNVARGFKGTGFAGQTNGVLASIAVTVSLVFENV